MNKIGITLHQGTDKATTEKQAINKTQLSAKPRLSLMRDIAQITKKGREGTASANIDTEDHALQK